MARQYAKQKRGQMVTLYGFTELVEVFDQLEKSGVDAAAEKVFDECCETIKQSVDQYSAQSLPADLNAKKKQFKVHDGNVFMFAYGWSRNTDLEDFMKVCYLNYGTPPRETAKGYNRGKIEPRGFLSNAKRSAAQKINKRKKDMLKEIMNGGNT